MLGRVALTNKLVSKSMGLEERLVESVMDFCFKEWATEFRECKHPYLYVQGLGTYGVNLATINKRIIFLLGIMRREKARDAKQSLIRRVRMIEGIRKEIFNLFEIRRNVRSLKRNNTQLRRNGKALINIERKLVQANRQEPRLIQEEDGTL